MNITDEPTADDCSNGSCMFVTDTQRGHAIWYPQMGGYVGKAVAVTNRDCEDPCIDVYVWHDGNFPFSEDGENPRLIHHCDADQFIEFGQSLNKIIREDSK